MKNRVYLDYNASTPLQPESRNAIFSVLGQKNGALNASSVHSFGRQGRKSVEDARLAVAQLVNATPELIIFNCGATESNNTVLRFFETQYPDEVILVSAIEHPSVLKAAKSIETIPVDAKGCVDLVWLEERLQQAPQVSLVSVMTVNNETGVIQDVRQIADITHRHGALFHSDATQAAGRLSLDIAEMGMDFMSLSSHKIGGPQGVGALVLGLCGQTPTLLHGGGQEKSARAGTENVAGIAGFGVAARLALDGLKDYKRLALLRDDMEARLKNISPDIVFHGKDAPRVGNTSLFSLPGVPSETMLMAMDLEGIALSNGSACSSGSVKASSVLKAMGVPDAQAKSALRVSTGWATTKDDIERFLETWEKLAQRWKS